MKKFVTRNFTVGFKEADTNGFPEHLFLPDLFGERDLFAERPGLFITLADGARLTGTLLPESGCEMYKNDSGADILEFQKLGFTDGRRTSDFSLSIRHEIYPDGTVFSNAFLVSQTGTPPDIAGFEVRYVLALRSFRTVRWALSCRPKEIDGTIIQTSAPERGLEAGEDRTVENGIFPLAGFNCYEANGPSLYAEFFMEGDNVLSKNKSDNCSSVRWKDGNAELTWNFQKKPANSGSRPWQWRNQWGFTVAAAPRKRHRPPFVMYHYFDNFKRYPTDEALKAIADSGASVLAIHENWRTDPQNGGMPFDPVRMREVVDFMHTRGIAVAPYIRGNEESVADQDCDWFRKYFKKDFDGLYMDYGGPFHYVAPADESFHSGRILFRKHYLLSKMRRDVVGKDGLILSHTGPLFSALGMLDDRIDGYVSGEGERGLLIRSRLDHAYYSMSCVCPGTMWTAAFPEYSEERMIPFLAATGQSPHSTLGVQFPSSSLAHPPQPGLNDVNFRPLWKLWNLFRNERDVFVYNDYNCRGVFPVSEMVGHYLMISKDAKRALLIFSNFMDAEAEVSTAAAWEETEFGGISGADVWLCRPDGKAPGKPERFQAGTSFRLRPYGVAALCVSRAPFEFGEYSHPYPVPGKGLKAYMKETEEQFRARYRRGSAPDWFLRVAVPKNELAYEESMIWDLYDNRFELGEITEKGFVSLGFIGKNGFRKDPTERPDFVWPGEQSVWIGLKEIVGPGKKKLAIFSTHRGELYYAGVPFYSFLTASLARTPDGEASVVEFRNELESDRAYLHFDVEIE